MPKSKVSKTLMAKLRGLGIEKLKELVKEHENRIAYANTRGDWNSIERDQPAIDYCETYIKTYEKKKEKKTTQDPITEPPVDLLIKAATEIEMKK